MAEHRQEEEYQTGDNQIVFRHRGERPTKYGKVGRSKKDRLNIAIEIFITP